MTREQLKEWRERNAVSQEKLAQLVGLHTRQVQRYEAGELEVPFLLAAVLRQIDGRVDRWEAVIARQT